MGHRPSCVPVVTMNFRISGAVHRWRGDRGDEPLVLFNREIQNCNETLFHARDSEGAGCASALRPAGSVLLDTRPCPPRLACRQQARPRGAHEKHCQHQRTGWFSQSGDGKCEPLRNLAHAVRRTRERCEPAGALDSVVCRLRRARVALQKFQRRAAQSCASPGQTSGPRPHTWLLLSQRSALDPRCRSLPHRDRSSYQCRW